MGAYNDMASMNSLFREIYSRDRVESMVFGAPRSLRSYLPRNASRFLTWSKSKSRRWRMRQAVWVAQDMLEQAGVYPFKRPDWCPDIRTDEEKARDIISNGRDGLMAWLGPALTEEERAAIFAKLADAGLLETEAHREFRDRPRRPAQFFGIDRTVVGAPIATVLPGYSAKVQLPSFADNIVNEAIDGVLRGSGR